jgi:hypothetical protein
MWGTAAHDSVGMPAAAAASAWSDITGIQSNCIAAGKTQYDALPGLADIAVQADASRHSSVRHEMLRCMFASTRPSRPLPALSMIEASSISHN